jgi:hypothetical protein
MFRKIRPTIAALAATFAVAAVAAAPANATDNTNSTPPKKGCTVNMQNPDGSPGQSIKYDHGYSFGVKNRATGKTHTYTCNDGKWDETVAFTPGFGGRPFAVVTQTAVAKVSGTLVVVSPQKAHTVLRNGRYHAAP